MIVALFMFFEIVVILMFIASFFTKQEILWALTTVFSGILMFTSYHVETYVYAYNETSLAYDAVLVTHNYPYLMGINMLFFVLSLVLGIFDIFDKYGTRWAGQKKEQK